MQNLPPSKFAAWVIIIIAIVMTLASWMGLPMSEVLSTNLTITWGIVSICHAIEWHARNTKGHLMR